MTRIEKPWGAEELIESERYVVKRITMNRGHQCSLQYHENKTETVIVLSGTLAISLGNSASSLETKEFRPGDVVTIRPGTIHRMRGIDDCIYFEASTCELDDVVRLRDDYQRI